MPMLGHTRLDPQKLVYCNGGWVCPGNMLLVRTAIFQTLCFVCSGQVIFCYFLLLYCHCNKRNVRAFILAVPFKSCLRIHVSEFSAASFRNCFCVYISLHYYHYNMITHTGFRYTLIIV